MKCFWVPCLAPDIVLVSFLGLGAVTTSHGNRHLTLLQLLLPSAEDTPLSCFLLAETLVRMKEVMESVRHLFFRSSREMGA